MVSPIGWSGLVGFGPGLRAVSQIYMNGLGQHGRLVMPANPAKRDSERCRVTICVPRCLSALFIGPSSGHGLSVLAVLV